MRHWLWPLLLLALVASIASAQRLTTFAWDADPNWPPGTTIELCGNGDVCLSGITGTQATLDLPVQPGAVIEGRARAIPPPGYQCGEPLAECPPSEWATLAQTWPALPVGGWARYETQVVDASMAISYLGYVVVDATGDISQAITVPANANYALIFRGGWASTAQTVTEISLDGTAATSLLVVAITDDYQDIYLHGVPVSSGSKTLVHNLSGSFTEGGKATVAFFSGVDTSNPVASDYTQYANSSSGTGAPTWALSSVADGIGAVFVSAYNNNTTITVTSQSQTSVFNTLTHNSNIYGFGHKATTGTSTTFGCSVTANYQYWTGVAVTLRPIQSGAAVAVPLSTAVVTAPLPAIETGAALVIPLSAVAITAPLPAVTTGAGIAIPASTVSITAPLPAVETGASIVVPLSTVAVTAPVPSISTSTAIEVPLSTVAVTAPVPSVGAGTAVVMPLSTVTVTAPLPVITAGAAITVPLATVAVTSPAPVIATGTSATVPLSSVAVTAPIPVIVTGFDIPVPLSTVGVIAPAPTVTTGAAIAIPLSMVSVTAPVPLVSSGETAVIVPLSTVAITAPAPVATAGGGAVVPLSLVSVTAPTPDVAAGGSATIPLLTVVVTAPAPIFGEMPPGVDRPRMTSMTRQRVLQSATRRITIESATRQNVLARAA